MLNFRTGMVSRYLVILAMSAILFGSSGHVRAQSLFGLKIGDVRTRLSILGRPADVTEHLGPFEAMKWQFPNGNELSVTFSKEGKIVYMESDWGGHSEGMQSDFPDLYFGRTALSDIRKKLGSNGMTFKRGTPVARVEGGVIMQNAYEVGDDIVLFTTEVNFVDSESVQATNGANISSAAKLVGLSLCSSSYAQIMWGDRVYDSNYKKIEWK